jgi:hypothetical protein
LPSASLLLFTLLSCLHPSWASRGIPGYGFIGYGIDMVRY